MSTEFHVVKHHGLWRIRVNGKHHGEYDSRIAAINAASVEAQSAGSGAKVFSTGSVGPHRQERQAQAVRASLPPRRGTT